MEGVSKELRMAFTCQDTVLKQHLYWFAGKGLRLLGSRLNA